MEEVGGSIPPSSTRISTTQQLQEPSIFIEKAFSPTRAPFSIIAFLNGSKPRLLLRHETLPVTFRGAKLHTAPENQHCHKIRNTFAPNLGQGRATINPSPPRLLLPSHADESPRVWWRVMIPLKLRMGFNHAIHKKHACCFIRLQPLPRGDQASGC